MSTCSRLLVVFSSKTSVFVPLMLRQACFARNWVAGPSLKSVSWCLRITLRLNHSVIQFFQVTEWDPSKAPDRVLCVLCCVLYDLVYNKIKKHCPHKGPVIRATFFFNLSCNIVAVQVETLCCTYYHLRDQLVSQQNTMLQVEATCCKNVDSSSTFCNKF